MSSEINNIIKESTFKVEEGKFVYVKVSEIPNGENYFMISKDAEEITVVTREKNFSELAVIERNKDSYRLIALNVSIPFYSVGFLATVSQAIAKEEVDILIVSTYSRDYIMVKEDKLEKTRLVLLKLGFKELK